MLLNPSGFSGFAFETFKLYLPRSIAMRSFISALLVGVLMVSLLVVPVACNSSGLFGWLNQTNTTSATVAQVATAISTYLNSTDAVTATNAQVLAKVSSLIPSAYAQFFSALVTALETAAKADEEPEAATKALKRDFATGRAIIAPELLEFCKQEAARVKKANK